MLMFPLSKRCSFFIRSIDKISSRLLSSSSEVELKKTCLYPIHVKNGAKMVPFAGYSMPLLYADMNMVESHLHTRKKASFFDVSHMLQTRIHGKDREKLVEKLTVADVFGLSTNESCLSLFVNEKGGIIDDLIVTRTDQSYLYIVSNAARAQTDRDLMESCIKSFRNDGLDVEAEFINDRYSLIAIQGPSSMNILQSLVEHDLKNLPFMNSLSTFVAGKDGCRVTRCGYTGEDGFEISFPNEHAVHICESLLGSSDLKLAGLGARDSLRLEAGLCLYGNDIDEETTPVEAGLVWTIGKSRREKRDFPGAEKILKQIKDKPSRKRVGLKSLNRGPAARAEAVILNNGNKIGKVTSGCPSPMLEVNIAMGYVSKEHSKLKSVLDCSIRNKVHKYEVVKMPFVPTNYYVRKS